MESYIKDQKKSSKFKKPQLLVQDSNMEGLNTEGADVSSLFNKTQLRDKLTSEEVRDAVRRIYPTQRELAAKLGMSEGNLSHRLNAPTPRLLKELEKVGVVVNRNKNVVNNGAETTAVMTHLLNMMKEISDLKERITRLEMKTG